MNDAASQVQRLAAVPTVQNTVRLWEQMQAQGYGDGDLRRVRSACAVAQSLFSGRMHPSGKPFLAHCIGIGGAFAALAATVDLIAAGLVHDAYRLGDFGPWRPFRARRRQWLQRALGEDAEHHVERCDRTPWDETSTEELRRHLPQDATDRNVVLIRLTAELDDLRDRSLLYSAEAAAYQERARRQGPAFAAIADALGFPDLSAALAAAVAETLASDVPPELRSRVGQTPMLPPESATPRLEAAIVGTLQRRR